MAELFTDKTQARGNVAYLAALQAQADADAASATATQASNDAAAAVLAAQNAQSAADGKAVVFYNTDPPTTGMDLNDLWIDSNDGNKLYIYNGTSWVVAQDQSIATALANAQTANNLATGAQATANRKIITYLSSTAPTAEEIGDLWVKTSDNNRLFRWNGTAWVDASDLRIAQSATDIVNLQSGLTAANGRIDGKAVVWVQTTAPTGLTSADTGDIWINTATTNRVTQVWNGTAFVDITDQKTLDTLATVNTKITTYYASTAPTAPTGGFTVGDLWVDTGNNSQIKRWSGSAWVLMDIASNAYVQARGTDLIANGTALLANNYNFATSFNYSGTDAPTGANGSFVIKTTTQQSAMVDELIPFDPTKQYKFTFQCRQTVAGQTNTMYGFIAPFDAFGSVIGPQHVMYVSGTTTTLAAPLNPGDTTITLTDASNWWGTSGKPAGGNTYNRGFIFWDYVDAGGKAWPVGSYSRNVYLTMYADGGITGNVITLSAPWAGPAKPAGTSLSNSSSGATYMYMPSASNVVVPQTWTTYTDTFTAGIMSSASQAVAGGGAPTWALGAPPGTAKIKVGWLLNYPAGGTGKHAIAAVSFSDASAAQQTANAAVKTFVTEYALSASETVAPTTGWSTTAPTRTPGNFIWYRVTTTTGAGASTTTNPALMTGNTGATGPQGSPAPLVKLTANTQVLAVPSGGGATTPATATVTGTASNTTITTWTYSVDGAAFSSTVPAGVSLASNVVTVTGSTMTARTIAIKAADANGISDTLTVAKVSDGAAGATGGTGAAGADAYTVLLTNEAQVFPGSTTAALAGSATTSVIAYKNTTQQTATIGTVTGQVTGLTTAITNNGTTAPVLTVTVTTALTTQSGTLTVPVTVGGLSFTKQFAWSVSYTGAQGATGATGSPGAPGAPAAVVKLTTPAQVLVSPAGGGATTPATTTVTGTATNTTIANWTYSVDGGAFSSTVPAGTSRTGSVVTITGASMTNTTITVQADNGSGVADTLTVAKATNGAAGATGGTGPAGADAYTVLLTNEAQVFPGSTNAALAGSATTSVIAYKNTTQQTATIGTITGQVTGLTTAITNNGTTAPVVTVTVTTALVTQAGTLTIPVTVAGLSFTKLFAWSVSYTGAQGATGATGSTGATGVSVTNVVPYYETQATGGATPTLPTTNPPGGAWTSTEPGYTVGTELWRTELITFSNSTFQYTPVSKVSAYTAAITAINTANGKNTVVYSTSVPGTATNTAGDIWWQYDGTSGLLISQWQGGGGTTWTQRQLDNQAIANLNVGKLVSGTIAAGQSITAGNPAANYAQLADTGFYVYSADAVDGIPNLAVRMGTSDPNIFSISDSTGLGTVASISDAGEGSFQKLYTVNDMEVKGRNLVGLYGDSFFNLNNVAWSTAGISRSYETDPPGIIETLPKGTVDWYQANGSTFTSTIPNGGEYSLFEMGFDCEPGRQYGVIVNSIMTQLSAAGATAGIRVRYTSDGSTPSLSSSVLDYSYEQVATANGYASPGIPLILYNGTDTTQQQLKVLVCMYVSGGTGVIYSGKKISGAIIDMGMTKLGSSVTRGQMNSGTPPPAPAPAPKTYIKAYQSTSSATYNGSGTKRTDTGDVVQGYNSYNGDGKGLWIFPNMTTDLSGATVNKVEVYCYANHWYYNAGGTALIKVHGYTSAPASSPSMTTAVTSASWPNPGGRWVTLPASMNASFASGTYRGFGLGPAGGTSLTYYGRFNGGSQTAQIRVTYTK